jgi:hypothetical protein
LKQRRMESGLRLHWIFHKMTEENETEENETEENELGEEDGEVNGD